MYQLFNGDCLDIMPTLPAQSVDAIITDLPYGTTACAWDSVIPFEDMWRCVKHVLKPNGAFVTTASQPFTSVLTCSNLKCFRCEWIWEKDKPSNPALAKFNPMKYHENIVIFAEKQPLYSPQKWDAGKPCNVPGKQSMSLVPGREKKYFSTYQPDAFRYPKSVLRINTLKHNEEGGLIHPTQKPVALYAYLIRTYTNPGDTVLDMCFGSNTTGVACIETGRNYIGIEKDVKYFELGQRRIEQAQPPLFVETGTPANNRLHATPGSAAQVPMFN